MKCRSKLYSLPFHCFSDQSNMISALPAMEKVIDTLERDKRGGISLLERGSE